MDASSMDASNCHVGIIGAGYAGLAAAVELTRAGITVSVFESSRTLGGRARVVTKDDYTLDNGQHILAGAYTETLKLMRTLRVPPRKLQTVPFTLNVPGRIDLRAASLPAPLHLAWGLLKCKELSWADRFAAIRLVRHLKRRRFALEADITVSELLNQTKQTPLLRELMWEPLCVAALNTPAEIASAQVFANVLRDTLAAGATASELLLPRTDLTDLLPFPATLYLNRSGASVYTATPIRRVQGDSGEFQLEGDAHPHIRYSHVIVATAPYHVSELLADYEGLSQLRQQIDSLPYEPITTVYLAYDEAIGLPDPMVGVSGSVVQWLFDRGQLGGPAGMIAAVISGSGPHTSLSREDIALKAHEAVEALHPRLPAPKWSQVITEKRATFSCRPGIVRPLTITPLPGLLLAGDYVDSPYPATIESAVRSGQAAARHIMRGLGVTAPAFAL
ncbi:hydroxysqualene dehydroxylase HpnE [Uliginosibacterium sp. H1]|uniref:hydroxysqualene dehydroxylase HpnE n=1 Tax=Uliginosibacterium sp. H1 TaxID=3114757 RepID=UPI002E17512C|nr:hydroxysqualene dehydroxylase HpnE [Uliginosibacterium sp. H1]